jgi:hypothetical protein
MVPRESYYYQDALLGLAWSAVMARQWPDCIELGSRLRQTSSRRVLKAEGAIVESFAYLQTKRYLEAAALLSSVYDMVQRLSSPDPDSLRVREEQYGMDRVVYDSLAEETNRFAQVEQVASSIQAMDQMHTRQRELKGTLDRFMIFRGEFARDTYFSRPIKTIQADVDYLYALAKRQAGVEKKVQDGLEYLRKQQDLNAEVERLKKELEELEEREGEAKPEPKPKPELEPESKPEPESDE